MIEQLLVGGRGSGGLTTGPGPQVLMAGNGRNGFFGETSSSQLITGQDLASLVGLTAGTLQNSATPWLKFFYNGEIVYIPKKNIRRSVTWNHLQAVNVVHGSRSIDIQGYQFRIELIEGLTRTPPAGAITPGYDVPWTHGSMWNELLYYVSQEMAHTAYHKRSQLGDNWANYPQDNTANGLNISDGNGRFSWCKETPSIQPTSRIQRGGDAVSYLNWYAHSTVNANWGWRPALFLLQ